MAKLVPFKKKRLQYAIEFHKKFINSSMSNNYLAYEIIDPDIADKESTFRRYKRNEKMPDEYLSKISSVLKVSKKYLTGEWNEKTPASVSVTDMMASLQGDDIIAKRTDPEGIYILPAEEEKRDLLLSEAVMQTQHYINTTFRVYHNPKTDRSIRYSDLFDEQHYYELFRIIEKIVKTAASQQLAYRPEHISITEIINQIVHEPVEITTIELK